MFEKLIKRVLWISKCPVCGEQKERDDKPPKERFCMACKVWVPYVEQSYTGPELKK